MIPISGLKKPQNCLNNPVYPDIKKDALRFVYSRKFWQVDPSEELKNIENYPMFADNYIEFQSRNRNETMYGKASVRDPVNLEVRYPLISPIDNLPQSRIPRRPVVPRINPGIPTQIFQDRMINGIFGYLTDRVKFPISGKYSYPYSDIDAPKNKNSINVKSEELTKKFINTV